MSNAFVLPKQVPLNSAGRVYPGAKAYFTRTGTSTPKPVYSDAALMTPILQPVTADIGGTFQVVYLDTSDGEYRLTLTTAGDAAIYTVDNVGGRLSQAEFDAFLETADPEAIGIVLYPRTAAEIAAGFTPTSYRYMSGDVRRAGAIGDGTDQTAELQAALDSGASQIVIPAGTYYVGTPLDVPSGVCVRGDGVGSILRMTSTTTTPNIFNLTSKTDVKIEQLALYPMNSGSLRAAVFLRTCTRVALVDCYIEGTDSTGCYAVDCDLCTWTRWNFRGAQPGNQGNGYPVFMIGCNGCTISESTAIRPRFGFTSGSNDVASLSIYGSTRAAAASSGNVISGCHVREQDGHAFDLISVYANVVTGCSAEDYSGSSTHHAFQIKDESGGDDTRMNVIANCTSTNNPAGFGAQGGTYGVFSNCTAIDSATEGFRLNGSDNFSIANCIARNFTTYGLKIDSSATSNTVNGLTLNTATAAAIGIGLVNAGAINNQFDNIALVGTFAKGIEIASGATNNRFGPNIRMAENSIDDVSGNSVWPVQITTPEINLNATGNVNGPYRHRGMVVARARFVITTTITGSPEVQCGQIGANTVIAAAQVISGSAGQTALLTQAAQLLNSGATMQGRCAVTGTGIGFFQYEGIARL